MITLVLLDEWR